MTESFGLAIVNKIQALEARQIKQDNEIQSLQSSRAEAIRTISSQQTEIDGLKANLQTANEAITEFQQQLQTQELKSRSCRRTISTHHTDSAGVPDTAMHSESPPPRRTSISFPSQRATSENSPMRNSPSPSATLPNSPPPAMAHGPSMPPNGQLSNQNLTPIPIRSDWQVNYSHSSNSGTQFTAGTGSTGTTIPPQFPQQMYMPQYQPQHQGYSAPPMYQQPIYQQQIYQQPIYQQPIFPQPIFPQPIFQQPIFQQPQHQPIHLQSALTNSEGTDPGPRVKRITKKASDDPNLGKWMGTRSNMPEKEESNPQGTDTGPRVWRIRKKASDDPTLGNLDAH